MFNPILEILKLILSGFIHIWPYLLLTVPMAVAVQMSGASRYIQKALQAKPMTAIVLATVVGAFSPFCSCGVIPIIASLLISGVPLAPVMSFWVASPSMDPEIFFLSVATLGWNLAVWRLVSTLLLSLSAGFITHLLVKKGLLGTDILRKSGPVLTPVLLSPLKYTRQWLQQKWSGAKNVLAMMIRAAVPVKAGGLPESYQACCSASVISANIPMHPDVNQQASSCGCNSSATEPFGQRLVAETGKAVSLVIKFMTLAFILQAVIKLYVPTQLITPLLGEQSPFAVLIATAIGVPFYTSNLSALPLISGLLQQGMDPAAALAFLISGPITTLPAMSAVWGIVNRRVFLLYLSFPLIGGLFFGYLYTIAAKWL